MHNDLRSPILACCLAGPNTQPLNLPQPDSLQKAAVCLRQELESQFISAGIEVPGQCWLQLQLREEAVDIATFFPSKQLAQNESAEANGQQPLAPEDQAPLDRHSHSLEQVLKKLPPLAVEKLSEPGGKASLKSRLLELYPDLEGSPQMDRLLTEAVEFSARGLGLQLAATSVARPEDKKRAAIYVCQTCDQAFVDYDSLRAHEFTHRRLDPATVRVLAEFELIAARKTRLKNLPAGISMRVTLALTSGWEWRLQGRRLLSGEGKLSNARAEFLKLLTQPGLPWLGDAIVQKHLLEVEKEHTGLLHHSLWSLGLTLRDVRCLLQRLHAAGAPWKDWLSFLEAVPEAVLNCREESSLPPGPLTAAQLDQLTQALLQLG